jgi:cytochrome c556
MKRLTLALSAALGLMLALPAAAQFQKPEDAIKYRKAAFTVMASHFGRLGPMAQGKVPFDAKVAADNIAIATAVSALPFAGFVPDSDKGDTKAKPEVWSDAAKFNAAAKKMQDAMAALNVAAKSGNADQFKAAFGETGKSCKGCHDDFRKE